MCTTQITRVSVKCRNEGVRRNALPYGACERGCAEKPQTGVGVS